MSGLSLHRGSWTAALLGITLAGAPLAAQAGAAQAVTPRQIAANAQAALLVVRAMSTEGDTLGSGTGFVISGDGTFVTNFHVISEAERLQVESLEGKVYETVDLIATDPARDLAVLKLPAGNLRPLRLGKDTDAQVGDPVYVMGNPMGMTGTFSDGMVSGKRPIEGVAMIQISAPISPGSSGGPVMNDRGEVIGVATLMLMGGQNINMAVPVQYVRPLLEGGAAPRRFTATLLPRQARAGLAALNTGPGFGRDHASAAPRTRDAAPRTRDAASAPARQVSAQFDAIRDWLRQNGFATAAPFWAGMLAEQATDTREMVLEAGAEYLITARCDNDCTDVDLGLYDAAGARLATDVEPDDYPTLLFTPTRTGTYRIVTLVSQCSAEPCAFGVAVYKK